MSALNICMKDDYCIIMQDAAVYAPDGEILEFIDKGVVIEGMNLFVGGTGTKSVPRFFAEMIENCFDDIDEIGDEGEPVFGEYYDGLGEGLHGSLGGLCVAVVGWSRKYGRARCVLFSDGISGRMFGGDIGANVHPALDGHAANAWRAHHGMGGINIVQFDAVRDGLHLMELQRRQAATMPGREGQFLIGGHVKLTEVRQDRIDQRTLWTWEDDAVGGRIIPGPMPEIAGRVASIAPAIALWDGLNRAERRRMMKTRKRSAA